MIIHRITGQKACEKMQDWYRRFGLDQEAKAAGYWSKSYRFCADLIDRIEQEIDGPEMWFTSSHLDFYLSFRDSYYRLDASVYVEPEITYQCATINYWMNPKDAPWPLARVYGTPLNLDAAVHMVRMAILNTSFIVESNFSWTSGSRENPAR